MCVATGQGACVQNVLDSVISSLLEDTNRKFIYVEMVIIIILSFGASNCYLSKFLLEEF